MKPRPAFTIIELILVIGLSGIVIMGLMQAYNNIMLYLKTIQEMQSVNRKACLLFNQMERDFMTAFIPPVLKKITPEKDGQTKEDKSKDKNEQNKKPSGTDDSENKEDSTKSPEDKKKAEEEKREALRKYFLASIDDNSDAKRINDIRTYQFKNVTFINTNPFQVYGQNKVRLVRVMYELVLDKTRSKGDVYCYNLWRKETENLENTKVKEDEVGLTTKSKTTQIRKILVADGIKEFFVQYVYQGRPKSRGKLTPEQIKAGESEQEEDKIEEKIFDVWGDDSKTIGVVPNRINVHITFWDEKLLKTVSLQTTFPVMSFSLLKEIDKKKDSLEKKAPETGSSESVQPGVGGQPGVGPAGAQPPLPVV